MHLHKAVIHAICYAVLSGLLRYFVISYIKVLNKFKCRAIFCGVMDSVDWENVVFNSVTILKLVYYLFF